MSSIIRIETANKGQCSGFRRCWCEPASTAGEYRDDRQINYYFLYFIGNEFQWTAAGSLSTPNHAENMYRKRQKFHDRWICKFKPWIRYFSLRFLVRFKFEVYSRKSMNVWLDLIRMGIRRWAFDIQWNKLILNEIGWSNAHTHNSCYFYLNRRLAAIFCKSKSFILVRMVKPTAKQPHNRNHQPDKPVRALRRKHYETMNALCDPAWVWHKWLRWGKFNQSDSDFIESNF